MDGINEAEVRDALHRFDPLWDKLFPAKQARIVQLLVERVDVGLDGADILLRSGGLRVWSVADQACCTIRVAEGGVMNRIIGDGRPMTVRVPILIRRRGGRRPTSVACCD
jgi:hypothetical protein